MRTRIEFASLVERLAASMREPERRLVALAGPPGAGKSHVTEALRKALDARMPGAAAVLPMDGYHLDDRLLEARGDRPRKGAPHTFDIEGFAVMLDRLAADDGRYVLVPVFDRDIEIARAGAREIGPGARLILVEGNYLLLDDPAWNGLAGRFDLTVFLEVADSELRHRLAARWSGLEPDALTAKLEGNDLPNLHLVQERSRPADLYLRND